MHVCKFFHLRFQQTKFKILTSKKESKQCYPKLPSLPKLPRAVPIKRQMLQRQSNFTCLSLIFMKERNTYMHQNIRISNNNKQCLCTCNANIETLWVTQKSQSMLLVKFYKVFICTNLKIKINLLIKVHFCFAVVYVIDTTFILSLKLELTFLNLILQGWKLYRIHIHL